MTYPFTCHIRDAVLDITLIYDFECEVEVEVNVTNGDLETYVSDVLLDGVSMRDGSQLGGMLRLAVMEAADAELASAGPLWDRVAADRGVSMTGPAGDPDTEWRMEA